MLLHSTWLDEFLEAVSQSAINNCSAELMSRGVSGEQLPGLARDDVMT